MGEKNKENRDVNSNSNYCLEEKFVKNGLDIISEEINSNQFSPMIDQN